jgi:hypothetical protein
MFAIWTLRQYYEYNCGPVLVFLAGQSANIRFYLRMIIDRPWHGRCYYHGMEKQHCPLIADDLTGGGTCGTGHGTASPLLPRPAPSGTMTPR